MNKSVQDNCLHLSIYFTTLSINIIDLFIEILGIIIYKLAVCVKWTWNELEMD